MSARKRSSVVTRLFAANSASEKLICFTSTIPSSKTCTLYQGHRLPGRLSQRFLSRILVELGGRVRKGNPYVRRLLCEFAHAASRTKSAFHAKFQSLIVRRGHKRAIVALALKMLRTIFFMLKRGDYYRDSATNYEQLSVQRNASRWIKALTRFGFVPAAA